MNHELMLLVADAIEKNEDKYYQSGYGQGKLPTVCGSACCIAGWAVSLDAPREVRTFEELLGCREGDDVGSLIHDSAQRLFGLNNSQAGELFDWSWSRANCEAMFGVSEDDFRENCTTYVPNANHAAWLLREIVRIDRAKYSR